MPNIDFEAIEEDSELAKKIKNRVSKNVNDLKVAGNLAYISAKNNFKNHTTKKLTKQQIAKYSDASYYGNKVRTIKKLSDDKKIKECKDEIFMFTELIKVVKQELTTAPEEISGKKKFASDALAAATGGIIGDTIDYNKDKWNQILDGLEGNKKRFEDLKKELSKTVKKESVNLLDW